jgi:hypothetical protein
VILVNHPVRQQRFGFAQFFGQRLDLTQYRLDLLLVVGSLNHIHSNHQHASRRHGSLCIVAGSEEFTTMRQLAMRFNGLFRERSAEKLDEWLRDAFSCGVFTMRRFAKTLRQDKSAVQNAVTEPWSNGQTEGQINRLKTLKRSMYGRASTELLRARMLPLQDCNLHRE